MLMSPKENTDNINGVRKKYLPMYVCFLLTYAVIFLLSHMTSTFESDYCVLKKIAEDEKGVFSAVFSFYNSWSGRFPVNIPMFFFITKDKLLFDVCNAFIYVLFTAEIYILSTGKIKDFNVYLYLLINISLWFFLRAWGECILWFAGSFQYLWAQTFELMFLIPYRLNLSNGPSDAKGIAKAVAIFIIGVIAGGSSENTGAAILVGSLLYVTYKITQKQRFDIWEYAGICGFIIGFMLLILAPGNLQRAACYAVSKFGFFDRICHGFSSAISNTLLKSVLAPFICFFALLLLCIKQNQASMKCIYLSLAFIAMSFCAHFSMIFAPMYAIRTTMPVVCFAIIAICTLISNISFKKNIIINTHEAAKIFCTCVLSCFFISFYLAFEDICITKKETDKTIEYISQEKAKNRSEAIIKPIYSKNIHNVNNAGEYLRNPDKSIMWNGIKVRAK